MATVLAIRLPVWVPSYAGHLSVEDAAAILHLAQPVRVSHAASFEDGGTVVISIQDAHDNGYAFRRSPWAREEPVHFYIDYPKKDGLPEKLDWGDPRLKALSILALNWVDTHFSPQQQLQIFEGRHLDEVPFPWEKERAAEVLWLFRKDAMEKLLP